MAEKALTLSSLAPSNVNGKAWVKLLKDQLLASKESEPTDAELLYFAQVAQASGLDPSKKEIYGIYRKVKNVPKLTIQTGIDGLRVVAERSGNYGGSKEYEFEHDPDYKITVNVDGTPKLVPNLARATVIKVVNGLLVETTRTAKWADYYPGDYLGKFWKALPELMLGKCAEAQALRAAFPNCSQLYLEEEVVTEESVDTSTDIVEQIKAANTREELVEVFKGLDVNQQKSVTELARQRAKEIENATAN